MTCKLCVCVLISQGGAYQVLCSIKKGVSVLCGYLDSYQRFTHCLASIVAYPGSEAIQHISLEGFKGHQRRDLLWLDRH